MSRHDFRNEHDHVKNLSDPPDSAEATMVGECVVRMFFCFVGTNEESGYSGYYLLFSAKTMPNRDI